MYEESFNKLPLVDLDHQIHLERYKKFISSRPIRSYKSKSGLCRHHVWPVSFGSERKYYKQKWNIIVLTYREHFIAHLILWQCYGKEMAKAFIMMSKVNDDTIQNIDKKLTAKQYERLTLESKEYMSNKFLGENSYKYGTGGKIICLNDSKIWNSFIEPSEYYNISKTEICACCARRIKSAKNLHFMYYNDYLSPNKNKFIEDSYSCNNQGSKNPLSKKVICVETKEIFDSMGLAAKKFNTNAKKIQMCCYNLSYTLENYHFALYEDYIKPSFRVLDKHEMKIKVICLEDNKIYDSLIEASNYYNVIKGNVSSSCKSLGKRYTGGYHFMYYNDYLEHGAPTKMNIGTHNKKIIRLEDKKVFNSIKDTEKECGFHGIYKSCISHGVTHVSHFHFMYYEEYLKSNQNQHLDNS